MTLVYAKIIGMFVCGAEPGGRGWGVAAGGWGVYEISSEMNSTHLYLSGEGRETSAGMPTCLPRPFLSNFKLDLDPWAQDFKVTF